MIFSRFFRTVKKFFRRFRRKKVEEYKPILRFSKSQRAKQKKWEEEREKRFKPAKRKETMRVKKQRWYDTSIAKVAPRLKKEITQQTYNEGAVEMRWTRKIFSEIDEYLKGRFPNIENIYKTARRINENYNLNELENEGDSNVVLLINELDAIVFKYNLEFNTNYSFNDVLGILENIAGE